MCAEPAAKKARKQGEPAAAAAAPKADAGGSLPQRQAGGGHGPGPAEGDDFQVVPLSRVAYGSDSSDSEEDGEAAGGSSGDESDFMENLDTQGKAEVLALAKRMLRRKSKDEIVEGAYNKYAFHDEGMPRWFAEDQMAHAR